MLILFITADSLYAFVLWREGVGLEVIGNKAVFKLGNSSRT